MKNLKRVLSLALATVMVIGMMVVGANAAFSDQSSIKYTNAVDTLVQLGVMNGMGDNTFAPNGTLTRAQAAKMVAYVKSGANATTISYYDGTTKFTDVTANHNWASGSINYCVANGIVTGMTATTFAPDASLTGAQLAKMMLVALGYPEKSENATQTLVGANWQLNAIRLATEAGLFAGLDSNFAATRAITREEAAQIMYNALFLNTWVISEYQNATPVYTKTGDKLIKSAFKSTSNTGTIVNGDYNRPATQYTFSDGKKAIQVAQNPVLTYTDTVTEGKLMADLGLSNANRGTVTAYVDGAAGTTTTLDRSATTTNLAESGKGVLVEVYTAQNDSDKTKTDVTIVAINTYLAKVKADPVKADAAKGTEASTTLTVYKTDATGTDMTFATSEFAKDTYVVVTISGGAVKTVAAAKSTVATVTAKNATKATITAGGTTYSFNKAAQVLNTVADYDLSASYTLYTDNYGNILGGVVYSGAVANLDAAYVNAASVVATDDAIDGVAATVRVKVTYMDGTSEVLPIEVKTATSAITTGTGKVVNEAIAVGDKYISVKGTDSTNYYKLTSSNQSTVASALAGKAYSYTKENGNIVLSNVVTTTTTPATTIATEATSVKVIKGNAVIDLGTDSDIYASNSTKLVLVGKDGTVTTYTGYANFPAETTYTVGGATGNVDAIVYVKTGSVANSILVLGGAAAANTAVDAYGYYLGLGEETADGQYYSFYVNGAVKSYLIADSVTELTSANIGRSFALTLGTKGEITTAAEGVAVTKTGTTITGPAVDVVGDGFVVINGALVYTTSATTVYNVTVEGTCSIDTLEKDDIVTYSTYVKDGVTYLAAAFIVK